MWNFLFSQYHNYPTIHIVLEITAVLFGLLSVWLAKQNNINVFPTGIVSTALYVYLLYQWGLLGDMLINAYYTTMSIYGWYIWSQNTNAQPVYPISYTTTTEQKQAAGWFIFTIILVIGVYTFYNKFGQWYSYVDTFTTAVFFVAMWLMAKRKVESWLFWLIGNLVSIPLYFIKGYTFTSFQYIVFTILAIMGYSQWKKLAQTQ